MSTALRNITANGIGITVALAGDGPATLLLHGFPHTWQVWSAIIPELARTRRVIAPDLRGLGGTTRADGGYDAGTLAEDALALLDALGVPVAEVVALDLGVPPAVLLALRHPTRVSRLVVMEAALAPAEGFARPWWFGFHAVPGLAERVVAGHEAEYLDFFWRNGLHGGRALPDGIRDAFLAGYRGAESLRCAFAHYRAMETSTGQLAAELPRRLTMPVTAIGAHPVGDVLHRQLIPFADRLSGRLIDDCGHIVPLDRPGALLELIGDRSSGAA